jgi:carbon storage regulator
MPLRADPLGVRLGCILIYPDKGWEEGSFIMLVLARKLGEKVVVPGCGMIITVLRVQGNKVRLGISAPVGVEIHREEVWQRKTDLPEAETCFVSEAAVS